MFNKGNNFRFIKGDKRAVECGKKNKGKKKPPFSDKHRKKLSEKAKKRKHSKKTKQKISKNHIGNKNGMFGRRKELSPNWQGGKSFEPYTTDWTKTLRQAIRERDKYTCQVCGEKQGERVLNVHHIDYNKKNCNPNNLICLCSACHNKTNFNRNYWIKYFMSLKKSCA